MTYFVSCLLEQPATASRPHHLVTSVKAGFVRYQSPTTAKYSKGLPRTTLVPDAIVSSLSNDSFSRRRPVRYLPSSQLSLYIMKYTRTPKPGFEFRYTCIRSQYRATRWIAYSEQTSIRRMNSRFGSYITLKRGLTSCRISSSESSEYGSTRIIYSGARRP